MRMQELSTVLVAVIAGSQSATPEIIAHSVGMVSTTTGRRVTNRERRKGLAVLSSKPIAIDLFAGLGGWAEGFLAEGYEVWGFDVIPQPYPGQRVLQDVLTLHGSQFKDATIISASPPCQTYSYMAMPWTRAKKLAQEYRVGDRDVKQLTQLFDACFRIQREASEAAGRYIPLIVENVKGAQPWVGRARWHYGSFYLWGDVPALMPTGMKMGRAPRAPNGVTRRMTTPSEWRPGDVAEYGTKNSGGSWFNVAHNTTSGVGNNPDGRKVNNHLNADELRANSSGSNRRKQASAKIAKIPFELARHIAHVFKPIAAL